MAKKIHCFKCGNVINDKSAATPFKHFTGIRYFCNTCAHHMGGYTWENGARQSAPTKAGFTLSKEFEIPNRALHFIDSCETTAALESRGWIGTGDCTVWKEFKTPIYNGLQSYTKTAKAIEQITRVKEWKNDNTYGTHTNIGHNELDIDAINIIRTWRETLLQPLENAMNDDMNRALYGRTWTLYADKMNHYGYGWQADHGCFINLQHDTHIEFRMNKVISAARDNRVNKYAFETVAALVDFAKVVKNNRATLERGEPLTTANRRAAEKTAAKLEKIYIKHASNALRLEREGRADEMNAAAAD